MVRDGCYHKTLAELDGGAVPWFVRRLTFVSGRLGVRAGITISGHIILIILS